MSKFKRFLAVFLAAVMMLSGASYADSDDAAAPTEEDAGVARSSGYFVNKYVTLTAKSGGVLKIEISVTGMGVMEMIGARTINIYKNGSFYTYVFYTQAGWEDIMAYNVRTMSVTKTYKVATGASYYVRVPFFASDADGSDMETVISKTVKT